MISKDEAHKFISERDRSEVAALLNRLDNAVKTQYNGGGVSIRLEKAVPGHILAALTAQLIPLGWILKYEAPGSDARGDRWNGSITIV